MLGQPSGTLLIVMPVRASLFVPNTLAEDGWGGPFDAAEWLSCSAIVNAGLDVAHALGFLGEQMKDVAAD